MKPILVVIPYHAGDYDITKKLLEWIFDLGECHPHSLLLCADSQVPREQMLALQDMARPYFIRVSTMIVPVPKSTPEKKVWAPNAMFLAAARQVKANYKHDFFWLESDAIPLCRGWLRNIAEAFWNCPRRFMGTIVKQSGQPGMPAQYLNGVAVYPNDAIDVFEKIQSVKDSSMAFDTGSAAEVVPKSMHTDLIHHYWGLPDMPPVFVEAKAPDAPKNHVTLDFISKDALVFHRSKDGKLIDLLRAKGVHNHKYEPECNLPPMPKGKLIAVEVTDIGKTETSSELEDENNSDKKAEEILNPANSQQQRPRARR